MASRNLLLSQSKDSEQELDFFNSDDEHRNEENEPKQHLARKCSSLIVPMTVEQVKAQHHHDYPHSDQRKHPQYNKHHLSPNGGANNTIDSSVTYLNNYLLAVSGHSDIGRSGINSAAADEPSDTEAIADRISYLPTKYDNHEQDTYQWNTPQTTPSRVSSSSCPHTADSNYSAVTISSLDDERLLQSSETSVLQEPHVSFRNAVSVVQPLFGEPMQVSDSMDEMQDVMRHDNRKDGSEIDGRTEAMLDTFGAKMLHIRSASEREHDSDEDRICIPFTEYAQSKDSNRPRSNDIKPTEKPDNPPSKSWSDCDGASSSPGAKIPTREVNNEIPKIIITHEKEIHDFKHEHEHLKAQMKKNVMKEELDNLRSQNKKIFKALVADKHLSVAMAKDQEHNTAALLAENEALCASLKVHNGETSCEAELWNEEKEQGQSVHTDQALHHQIQALKVQIDAKQHALNNSRAHIQHMEQSGRNKQQTIDNLQAQLKEITSDLEDEEIKVLQLENQQNEHEHLPSSDVMRLLQSHMTPSPNYNGTAQNTNTMLTQAEMKVCMIKYEQESTKHDLERANDTIQSIVSENTELVSQMSILRHEVEVERTQVFQLSNTNNKLEQKLLEESKHYQEEIRTMEDEIKILKAEHTNELKVHHNRLTKQYEKYNLKISSLQDNSNKEESKHYQEEIRTMEDEIKILKAEHTNEQKVHHNRLTKQYEKYNLKISSLQDNSNKVLIDLRTAEISVASLKESKESLKAMNQQLDFTVKELKSHAQEKLTSKKLMEQKIKALKSRLAEIEDIKAGLEVKVTELKNTVNHLETDRSAEHKKCTQLKIELRSQTSTSLAQDQYNQSLHMQLSKAQADKASLHNEMKTNKQNLTAIIRGLRLEQATKTRMEKINNIIDTSQIYARQMVSPIEDVHLPISRNLASQQLNFQLDLQRSMHSIYRSKTH